MGSTLLRENILQLANRLSQQKQLLFESDGSGEAESSLYPAAATSSEEVVAEDATSFESTSLFALLRGSSAESTNSNSESGPAAPSGETGQGQATPSSDDTPTSQTTPATAASISASGHCSPWIRNAGRKKSHPVWEFFRDMKGTDGSGSVVCMHCSWSGDDRSPNNLRTHLKKAHSVDGIFNRFSEKLAMTPTQPYVKRVRGGGNHNQSGAVPLQSEHAKMMSDALSFLDSIPRIDDVINISFDSTEHPIKEEETLNEAGCSGAMDADRASSSPPAPSDSVSSAPSGGSPSVSSSNPLNSFIMAANPLVYLNAVNALAAGSAAQNASSMASTPPGCLPSSIPCVASHGSAFTLNDGSCVAIMMKMALDLDLTLSYHRRRADIELVLESNRTAEKSGGRGKLIALCDLGREIRVTERVNGNPTDTELWTKTDFNQFHWAIRGKCAKVLQKL